jgi:hypothetical protein
LGFEKGEQVCVQSVLERFEGMAAAVAKLTDHYELTLPRDGL